MAALLELFQVLSPYSGGPTVVFFALLWLTRACQLWRPDSSFLLYVNLFFFLYWFVDPFPKQVSRFTFFFFRDPGTPPSSRFLFMPHVFCTTSDNAFLSPSL